MRKTIPQIAPLFLVFFIVCLFSVGAYDFDDQQMFSACDSLNLSYFDCYDFWTFYLSNETVIEYVNVTEIVYINQTEVLYINQTYNSTQVIFLENGSCEDVISCDYTAEQNQEFRMQELALGAIVCNDTCEVTRDLCDSEVNTALDACICSPCSLSSDDDESFYTFFLVAFVVLAIVGFIFYKKFFKGSSGSLPRTITPPPSFPVEGTLGNSGGVSVGKNKRIDEPF